MQLMSGEIKGDQDMILLLSEEKRRERLAAFVYNLSRRFAEARFLSARVPFDHGPRRYNYLSLTVETISQLLGRFRKAKILSARSKIHHHRNADALSVLAGTPRINVTVNLRILLPDHHFHGY